MVLAFKTPREAQMSYNSFLTDLGVARNNDVSSNGQSAHQHI